MIAGRASLPHVPQMSLAVPGRSGQYSETAPEGRVPRATSGFGGARLSSPGSAAHFLGAPKGGRAGAGAGEGRAA